MIALGAAASAVTSYKVYSMWFPPERLPLVNGLSLAAGGLGLMAGTTPVEVALTFASWRSIHVIVGILLIVCAVLVPAMAPPKPSVTVARKAVPRHHPRWEPGALAAPAGICAGGGEKSPSLPRPPGWQGFSSRTQHWSVQPCVRPLNAVHMTAGHNALRGSGPGQKPAFDNALARVGCPDRRIDRLCITCCSPSLSLPSDLATKVRLAYPHTTMVTALAKLGVPLNCRLPLCLPGFSP